MIFQYRYGELAWFWLTAGTTLLIGFIAGRRRFFQDIPGHLPIIRKITWWSAGVGLALAAAFAIGRSLATGGGGGINALTVMTRILYTLQRPMISALYMGAVVLLAQRPFWRAAMSPLASVGRMPLTNYLMQSVIATTLFYGYAFGLDYRISPAVGILIALAIFAVQVAYSAWWMARFRFGPMEWLWRTRRTARPPHARAGGPAACGHSPRGARVGSSSPSTPGGRNDFEAGKGDVHSIAPGRRLGYFIRTSWIVIRVSVGSVDPWCAVLDIAAGGLTLSPSSRDYSNFAQQRDLG